MANPVIGRCPICSEALRVVRLECESCGTRLEGNFTLGRFQALTADQLEFLETFIIPFDEAIAMIRDGQITDAKSVAGLLWVDKYGR